MFEDDEYFDTSLMDAIFALGGNSTKVSGEMIAHTDDELGPWIFGIADSRPTPAGSFLRALADAALKADFENYQILRPALLQIRDRYPEYRSTWPERETK